MGFEQYVLLGAVIAGATELFTRIRARDFWTAGTIAAAAIIGGLFGYFGYYPDLDVVKGVAAGFAASGAISALGAIGNKSAPTESKLLEK